MITADEVYGAVRGLGRRQAVNRQQLRMECGTAVFEQLSGGAATDVLFGGRIGVFGVGVQIVVQPAWCPTLWRLVGPWGVLLYGYTGPETS